MLHPHYRHPYGTAKFRHLAILILPVCFGFSSSSWGEQDITATTVAEAPLELDPMTVTSGADPSLITPSFETVKQEFMRRPGGQTVIDSDRYKRGKIANQQDIFRLTPGVWTAARNAGTSTRISIRGSDIDASGPRNGRGVRSFQDGIPYGRLEAGTTNSLIDILATDYVEIYRGPNGLRLGALATGGAVNYVSKTGHTANPLQLRADFGSYSYFLDQISSGNTFGNFDYYASFNSLLLDGFRNHNEEQNYQVTSNFGYRLSENIENRFYFSWGDTNREIAGSVPLNEVRTNPRQGGELNELFDTDANFNYYRFADKLSFRIGDNQNLDIGAFFIITEFDHLPTPFSGFVDNKWYEGGLTAQYERTDQVFGRQNKFLIGARAALTHADFLRFQHQNGGQDKGIKTGDWDFKVRQYEGYFENDLEVVDRLHLFLGLQAIYAQREQSDNFFDFIPSVRQFFPTVNIQPGSLAGDQSFNAIFRDLNPKFGLNYEFAPDMFVFTNFAKSFEPPTSSDLNDLSANGLAVDLDGQDGYTVEFGTRGTTERFNWDVTFYQAWISKEILTRCLDLPACDEDVAFNADSTIHRGLETAFGAVLWQGLFGDYDSLQWNAVYNWSDFFFDDDEQFGDNDLPVIPEHSLYTSLEYVHPSGFYAGPNLNVVSSRDVTFDGSGGDAFVVPGYTLYGFQVGYRDPKERFSLFLDMRNLSDKAYTATFSALPQATVAFDGSIEQPGVRPGDGIGIYGGIEVRF